MLIVIEGQDATGKDTQAKLLVDFLKSRGETVLDQRIHSYQKLLN